MWLLVLEGLAIGCLLGLTGAGGGILAVPALMASQGWTVSQAAPVGLLAVTLSAFVGMVQRLIQENRTLSCRNMDRFNQLAISTLRDSSCQYYFSSLVKPWF